MHSLEMSNLDQRIIDVYIKCDEIVAYLNEINSNNKKKDIVAYYTVCIAENLNSIKEFISELHETIQTKEGSIHVLQNAVKGLHEEFDDLDIE